MQILDGITDAPAGFQCGPEGTHVGPMAAGLILVAGLGQPAAQGGEITQHGGGRTRFPAGGALFKQRVQCPRHVASGAEGLEYPLELFGKLRQAETFGAPVVEYQDALIVEDGKAAVQGQHVELVRHGQVLDLDRLLFVLAGDEGSQITLHARQVEQRARQGSVREPAHPQQELGRAVAVVMTIGFSRASFDWDRRTGVQGVFDAQASQWTVHPPQGIDDIRPGQPAAQTTVRQAARRREQGVAAVVVPPGLGVPGAGRIAGNRTGIRGGTLVCPAFVFQPFQFPPQIQQVDAGQGVDRHHHVITGAGHARVRTVDAHHGETLLRGAVAAIQPGEQLAGAARPGFHREVGIHQHIFARFRTGHRYQQLQAGRAGQRTQIILFFIAQQRGGAAIGFQFPHFRHGLRRDVLQQQGGGEL
ncbi:MAG: hypothetical protein AW09_002921 [Candidatus Accumulibacter phosphatis]|uniref:Uncharacterized protein n=1 Tax=Candidatus Accumulibacter phosphatis TaxID=327160 RepID=A0A080LTX0_9PROT|nr:MAG: hypothetical protein AW09_002921 [Candidatus Accumulibacter phosphatis]